MSRPQATSALLATRLSSRAAAACALATALGFGLAAPPLALWPLAGICLAPLIRALQGRSLFERCLVGAATGVLSASTTVVVPLGSALAAFFDLQTAASLAAAFGLAGFFAGAGFALFAALAGSASPQSTAIVVRVAGAWVAGDLLRSHMLTGLPWLLLGHFLAPIPELCQLAAIGGTAMVSFWLAALNACVAALFLAPRLPACWLRAAAVLALGSALSLAFVPTLHPTSPGFVAEATSEREVEAASGEGTRAGARLQIALVQPALPSSWRLSPDHLDRSLTQLRSLSASAGAIDLLVWPENAVPLFLPANAGRIVAPILDRTDAPKNFLLGAPRFDGEGSRRFNSAFLYRRGRTDSPGRQAATLVGVHDKVQRVPFTEFRPWLLPSIESRRAVEIDAGAHPTVLGNAPLRIGPLICYELLFSDVARSLVEDGAQILVNLSHDGYFGGPAGAEQHMSAAVLRAIEFRRPLLRATSDGLTVAVDAAGRVQASLAVGEAGVLRVAVVPGSGRSPFSRSGDLFAWLAAAAAIMMSIRREFRG